MDSTNLTDEGGEFDHNSTFSSGKSKLFDKILIEMCSSFIFLTLKLKFIKIKIYIFALNKNQAQMLVHISAFYSKPDCNNNELFVYLITSLGLL